MTTENSKQALETLTGGQRQDVAVARAAAISATVIIMDEPTTALEVKKSWRVLDSIKTAKARGMAIVLLETICPRLRGR